MDIFITTSSAPAYRMMRLQKENEEAERRKLEGAIQREQELQEFIKEKEREILQLQVCVWFSLQSVLHVHLGHYHR